MIFIRPTLACSLQKGIFEHQELVLHKSQLAQIVLIGSRTEVVEQRTDELFGLI